MTKELVKWLIAQINDDEEAARKAPPGPWIGTDADDIGAWSVYDREWLIASAKVYNHDKPMGGRRGPGYIDASAVTAHIARHDPARVLREIEADRQLLAQHVEVVANDVDDVEYAHGWANALGLAVRLCATKYSDRPGYREEWRP